MFCFVLYFIDTIFKIRESPFPMIQVSDALFTVLAESSPLAPTRLHIIDCLNRMLLEDILAKEDYPPFRACVMDGYAIISSDGPGEYPVISSIEAGDASFAPLKSGQTMWITTGAPLPGIIKSQEVCIFIQVFKVIII